MFESPFFIVVNDRKSTFGFAQRHGPDAVSIPVDLTNQPLTVLPPSVTGGARQENRQRGGRRRTGPAGSAFRQRKHAVVSTNPITGTDLIGPIWISYVSVSLC